MRSREERFQTECRKTGANTLLPALTSIPQQIRARNRCALRIALTFRRKNPVRHTSDAFFGHPTKAPFGLHAQETLRVIYTGAQTPEGRRRL